MNKMTLLKFYDHFENVVLKICKTHFRILGHAFTMNINPFFLPVFTEANNVIQCNFSTYTFEFAPNAKEKNPTKFRLFWH